MFIFMMTTSLFHRLWVKILVIILLGFTGYSFMFNAPFKTMDDQISIANNLDIRSFSNIGTIFQKGFFGDRSYYRPLVSLSFMVEYYFFELNPLFYNLTNVGMHLLTAAIVFFLIRRMLQDDNLAFFVSLLFAIHPVHWEAVSNIAGRSIVLCSFFFVAAFLFYYLFSIHRKQWVYYILSVMFFVLAMLSKEAAAFFPLLVVSYELLFPRGSQRITVSKALMVLPFFVVVAAYASVRYTLGMTEIFHWASFRDLVLGVMTFLRAMGTNLRICFLPVDLHFDRGRAFFKNFADVELGLTSLAYLAIIFFAIRMRKKITPPVLFFMSWVVVALLPVSQIFPISIQPGYLSTAEHFLYPSSIGIFVLMALLFRWFYQQGVMLKLFSKKVFIGCVGGFYAFLFLVLVGQNIYASQEMTMCRQAVRHSPWNVRMRNSLGLAYAQKWLFPQAAECFRRSLEIDPENAIARISLGKALCDQGRFLEGIQEYDKVVNPNERLEKLLKNNIRLSYELLMKQYQKKLKQDPHNAQLHYSLAVAYSRTGKIHEAIEEYHRALDLNPSLKEALFNLAASYDALGRREEARAYYEKIIALGDKKDVMDSYAYGRLGTLYSESGDAKKSERYAKESLKIRSALRPDNRKLGDQGP